jgi:hypothetical protein
MRDAAKGGHSSVDDFVFYLSVPREKFDRIYAEEGEELKPLLGRPVKSWRELVDAIDWSWVLGRAKELADAVRPWIVGHEEADEVERIKLLEKMLEELALFVRFIKARKGLDDGRWREERARRLAKAVETLSMRKITGKYADEFAELMIESAEKCSGEFTEEELALRIDCPEEYGRRLKERLYKLARKLASDLKEDVKKIMKEFWIIGVGLSDRDGVERVKRWFWDILKIVPRATKVWEIIAVLDDAYCLAKDCAKDDVAKRFIAPALKLIMLDKALRGKYPKDEALLYSREMIGAAIKEPMGPDEVALTIGGELGGGAAFLNLAALRLLNELLPNEMKFKVQLYAYRGVYYVTSEILPNEVRIYSKPYPKKGTYYRIIATGEDAARFMRLLVGST